MKLKELSDEKCIFIRIDRNASRKNRKFIEKNFELVKYRKNENLENLGCAKIKGAQNGSDARKLEGAKMKFRGARRLKAQK